MGSLRRSLLQRDLPTHHGEAKSRIAHPRGREDDGSGARKRRLISKILPKESFIDDVVNIARRVAAQPSCALKFNKRLLMEPIRAELLAANERECQGLRERGRTAEPREAIADFEVEQEQKRKARL